MPSLVIDTATIAGWNTAGVNALTATSAAFTAAANSLLVISSRSDGDVANFQNSVVTDSLGGVWTKWIERNGNNSAYSACAALHTMQTGPVAASRTVTITMPFSKPIAGKGFVVTGHNISNPVGRVGSADSALSADNIVAYRSSVPFSRGVGASMDWNNGTTGTSSDTVFTQQVTGAADGLTLLKAADTIGIDIPVSFNLQMTSTPNWLFCAIELIPATVPAQADSRRTYSVSMGMR